MRPGLMLAPCILVSVPLAADWAGPMCTAQGFSTQAPFSQGRSGKVRTGKTYSNWQWKDPSGTVHSFPGTSRSYTELEPIPGMGFIPLASSGTKPITEELVEVQASDGSPIYLTTEGGGKGRIEVRHRIYPKYKVLSVIYAPPGNGSQVSYGSGFGMGTTTSISHSYSDALNLSFSVGKDDHSAETGIHAGLGFNESTSTEDGRSLSLTTMQSGSRTWSSTADGIDHGQDNEYLLKALARPWSEDGGHSVTWTDTTSRTSVRSTSASCDLQIRQPAQDWNGPTRVAVYADERFGTFLFVYVK